jgi:prepilin-type N-terminal cleavage/methylation domain-containing protein
MNKSQNKSGFTIVETLVAVTIVAIAMSMLLEAISQSTLIYNRILSKQNSIAHASLLILSPKTNGRATLFGLTGQIEQKATTMSLQNSAGMFLNIESSTLTLDNNEKMDFIRLGRF